MIFHHQSNLLYIFLNNNLVLFNYRNFFLFRNLKNTGVVGWFKQNKFLTFVLGYVVLLVSVGLTQNKNVEKYYKLLIQKAGLD